MWASPKSKHVLSPIFPISLRWDILKATHAHPMRWLLMSQASLLSDVSLNASSLYLYNTHVGLAQTLTIPWAQYRKFVTMTFCRTTCAYPMRWLPKFQASWLGDVSLNASWAFTGTILLWAFPKVETFIEFDIANFVTMTCCRGTCAFPMGWPSRS